MNELWFFTLLTAVAIGALALAGYSLFSQRQQSSSVIATLDNLLRLNNDRCLNISDSHLQAKRDEWDGRRTEAPFRPVARPETPPDREVTQWPSVSAAPS